MTLDGHAVEARDLRRGPRPRLPARRRARCSALREPSGPGIRVDARWRRRAPSSAPTTTRCWPRSSPAAPDRDDRPAPASTARSAHTAVLGRGAPTPRFLRALLRRPRRRAGRLDTGLIERRGDALTPPTSLPAARPRGRGARAACSSRARRAPSSTAWDVPDGWRLGEPRLDACAGCRPPAASRSSRAACRGRSAAARGGGRRRRAGAGAAAFRRRRPARPSPSTALTRRYRTAHDGGTRLAGRATATPGALREQERLQAARTPTARPATACVTAPMPGTVTVVRSPRATRWPRRTPLLVVEAMKMEHVLTAPVDGVVTRARP